MKYQLAIFDLDGTLLDTLEDLADSTNYIMQKFGYPERTIKEVRNFVGNGIRKLLERSAPLVQRQRKLTGCLSSLRNITEHIVRTKPNPMMAFWSCFLI